MRNRATLTALTLGFAAAAATYAHHRRRRSRGRWW